MVIVFDTDILSMFAKIDEVYLLKQLFGDKAVMTPKVRDEISAPLEYGYTFPLKVLSTIKTVPLSEEAIEEYVRFQWSLNLEKGNLKLLLIARRKNGHSQPMMVERESSQRAKAFRSFLCRQS